MPVVRSRYAVGNVPGTYIEGQPAIDPVAVPRFSLQEPGAPFVNRFADPLPANPMLAVTGGRRLATDAGQFSNIRLGLEPTGMSPILFRPGGLLYTGPAVR